jgi:hypothetical protein
VDDRCWSLFIGTLVKAHRSIAPEGAQSSAAARVC